MHLGRVALAIVEFGTYQIIQFYCGNTLVDTGDDLLCDCCSINMLGVEAITQS
jgi:hypothetical protein